LSQSALKKLHLFHCTIGSLESHESGALHSSLLEQNGFGQHLEVRTEPLHFFHPGLIYGVGLCQTTTNQSGKSSSVWRRVFNAHPFHSGVPDDRNMASGGDVRVKEATGAPCSHTGNRVFGIEARSGPVATIGEERHRSAISWAGSSWRRHQFELLAVKQRVEGVEADERHGEHKYLSLRAAEGSSPAAEKSLTASGCVDRPQRRA
jgi:hypothetical protein